MKKILLSLLTLCCTMVAVAQTTGADYVEVSTGEELRDAIQNDFDANIKLTDDVCIKGLGTLAPIFEGNIDGQGHAIYGGETNPEVCSPLFGGMMNGTLENITFRNIRVENTTRNEVGIIGNEVLSCHLTSLRFENCQVYCKKSSAGIVAGLASQCVFTSVVLSNTDVTVDEKRGGGLIGSSETSLYQRCVTDADCKVFVEGPLWDTAISGGLVGFSIKDTFSQCINHGRVVAKQNALGGIVGHGYGVTITNCLNTGFIDVDTKDTSGSIIGVTESRDGIKCKITNCLSTQTNPIIGTNTSGDIDPASGYNYRRMDAGHDTESNNWDVRTDNAFIESGLVALWLNNGADNVFLNEPVWTQTTHASAMKQAQTYPVPVSEGDVVNVSDIKDVFMIETVMDFLEFASYVNDGTHPFMSAILKNDLDFTELQEAGLHFSPVGTESHPYRGFFDGQGHTVKGASVSGDKPCGLFGVLDVHANINNVNIAASAFTNTADGGAGALVGSVRMPGRHWGNVVIGNCVVGDEVSVKARNHGGGLIGRAYTDRSFESNPTHARVYVYNCGSMAAVTASDGNSGLLCGYMDYVADVRYCWSGGELRKPEGSGTPYDHTYDDYEFFVGYNHELYMKNCYAAPNNVDGYDEGNWNFHQQGVVKCASEDVTSGKLTCLLLSNVDTDGKRVIWQQNLGTDKYPMPAGNRGLHHVRNLSSQYGTACFPIAVRSDANISYYRFVGAEDGDDIKLKFSYTESVPAGVPVLYRSEKVRNAAAEELPMEVYFFRNVNASIFNNPAFFPMPGWYMMGTFDEQVFTESSFISSRNIYYVSKDEIKNAKKVTIAPYRAFFHGPSINTLNGSDGSMAKTISLVVEDEDGIATVIQSPVEAETSQPRNLTSSVYNIHGQKVNDGYRGIVIKNGKKIINNK